MQSIVLNLTAQIGDPEDPAQSILLRRLLALPEAPTPATTASAGVEPPASGEPWAGQGGRFICTMPAIGELPARHLVAHTAENERLTWGSYGEEFEGAKSRVDGRANTAVLLARAAGKHPAAEWAAAQTADGHSDFYLPSQAELFMASLYAPQLFTKEGWYWSSTQGSRDYAFVQDFEGGNSRWSYKGSGFRVRAFRSIHLTA